MTNGRPKNGKLSYILIFNKPRMPWPFKDYDFYGNKFADVGEIMWYDREDIQEAQTECVICLEAENEMYTKYAHPKAHSEATAQASVKAEELASKEKDTEEYLDYYTFYYGREYIKIYKELYKKYKEEYSKTVLRRSWKEEDKICPHHLESIQYEFS